MRFSLGNESFTEGVTEVSPIDTTYDATPNDSNKSWVVPNGEVWRINWAHVRFSSSATVGNRLIGIAIKDESGNEIYDIFAAAVQGASIALRHYNFVQGIYRETAVAQGEIQTPIPIDLYLKAGYTLQIWDTAAIDAAADDLIVAFQAKVYKGA